MSWKAKAEDNGLVWVGDKDGNTVATLSGKIMGGFRFFPFENAEANSNLIAAAPELLGVVKRFLNGIELGLITSEEFRDLDDLTEAAKVALAKAKGESNET